jgi:UDP-N-acetylmuramate dehydrogenase
MTAAELIEQAGLKGSLQGGASLYDRNPNFIVLEPTASCDDLLQLIDHVRNGVESMLGVDLEKAVQIW